MSVLQSEQLLLWPHWRESLQPLSGRLVLELCFLRLLGHLSLVHSRLGALLGMSLNSGLIFFF